MRKLTTSFVSGIAIAGVASAQSEDAPPPPCSTEPYQQFDFWLGDWEVISKPQETIAGFNSITREENGCLIQERWEGMAGGTGQSYNYYNPATEKWRQVWVSQGAMIDYEGGLTESGSMKLTGTITYVATSQTADFTGEWTPNKDGTVTQHFEQYDPEKDEWTVWFTGHYTKIEPETTAKD